MLAELVGHVSEFGNIASACITHNQLLQYLTSEWNTQLALGYSRWSTVHDSKVCRVCIIFLVHVSKFWNIPLAYGTPNQSL